MFILGLQEATCNSFQVTDVWFGTFLAFVMCFYTVTCLVERKAAYRVNSSISSPTTNPYYRKEHLIKHKIQAIIIKTMGVSQSDDGPSVRLWTQAWGDNYHLLQYMYVYH